jgi:hypothetical protein
MYEYEYRYFLILSRTAELIKIECSNTYRRVFYKSIIYTDFILRKGRVPKTPWLGAGKTGSENCLPVDQSFSLSEGLRKEYK